MVGGLETEFFGKNSVSRRLCLNGSCAKITAIGVTHSFQEEVI
jgi:hypothetical protein